MSDASSGPSRRTVFYALPLAIFTVTSTIGVAFMPYFLARAPLVLIALSPLFRHIVLVSPGVSLTSLLCVAVPRHFAPDPFVYLLGRDYGPVAVEWVETNSPAVGKWVRALEKVFARVGPLALLVSPDIAVSTLAGVARVRFSVFCAMNLAGTVANVIVARWFGAVLEAEIRSVVGFFQSHLLLVTAASLLVVAGLNWYSSWKREQPKRGGE